MIPESIKIDDNGDFEIKVTSVQELTYLSFFTFEEIEEAYLLAKSKKQHGCYVDSDKGDGEIYSTCCIDENYDNCGYAGLIKCKTDCQYWQPVEVKK